MIFFSFISLLEGIKAGSLLKLLWTRCRNTGKLLGCSADRRVWASAIWQSNYWQYHCQSGDGSGVPGLCLSGFVCGWRCRRHAYKSFKITQINMNRSVMDDRVTPEIFTYEAAQVPISRWADKTTMGHLHSGILLGRKKEENFTLCDSMDGPGEHYAKWNKPVRERQIHLSSLICGIQWTN